MVMVFDGVNNEPSLHKSKGSTLVSFKLLRLDWFSIGMFPLFSGSSTR